MYIVSSIIYHYLSQLINVNVFRIVLHDGIKKKKGKKAPCCFKRIKKWPRRSGSPVSSRLVSNLSFSPLITRFIQQNLPGNARRSMLVPCKFE